jgi:ABC-2 type transport system permease protein
MDNTKAPRTPAYDIGTQSAAPQDNPALIADLSYRGYDGPLEAPYHRWISISQMVMKLAIKKRGFWIWSILSAWYFLLLIGAFYLAEEITEGFGQRGGTEGFFKQIVWKDLFLTSFSYAQIFYFVIALLVGVGAIANDNRANALLVYLSKPCSKGDYLIGKWFGIAGLIFLVALIPNVLFYFYCLLSYRQYGFWTQDPWMLPRLVLMSAVPAVVHASLSLGVSSLFNQGRLAGATYGAIYFILYFLTTAFNVLRVMNLAQRNKPPEILDTLVYFSVDGLQIAMAKIFLHTQGGGLMRMGRRDIPLAPIPSVWLFGSLIAIACALFMWVAWSRVRAVEVVA